MPEGDPWYIRALDRLGVNTTRLRWRMYQREQHAMRILETGVKPPAPSWWSYPNKICLHCRAISNRESAVCDSCGRRLPSMWGYRIRRLVLGAVPAEGPAISMGFLTVMVLFWGAQILTDGIGLRSVMGPSGNAIHALGEFASAYAVRDHQYWRFLAFGLVHGGLLHIGMNSYFLVQIGPLLESQLSRARMLTLVTISQLTSGLMCFVWYTLVQGFWYQPKVVGASGWLFGLLGFGIIWAHRAGMRPMRDSLIRSAAFMFVLGLMVNSMAAGGGISNAAHFGGLVGGLFFGILPESGRNNPRAIEKTWNVLGGVSLALWIAAIVFAAISTARLWAQMSAAQ